MSDHNAPTDSKSFTLTAFIAFVVVFVFAMIMMLWHGNTTRDADGNVHYETHVSGPTDGNGN